MIEMIYIGIISAVVGFGLGYVVALIDQSKWK